MLAELEDWDTYKGASIAGEKPLKAPLVKIKDNLKVALSSPPKAQQMQLCHVFRSWKLGLDGGRKDDAASPLLACFFASQYEVASFKTSSLKEADAMLMKSVAPLAKAYSFTLHFAHTTYTEIGNLTFDESSYYQCGVTRSHVMDNPDYDYRYHYNNDDL
ncbi:hypothetical protein CPB85DRAFT_1428741 [Mucidula mucida]|nr:hypothetical protein CPB85DRAFT_1428741 [Mucidula mucida]